MESDADVCAALTTTAPANSTAVTTTASANSTALTTTASANTGEDFCASVDYASSSESDELSSSGSGSDRRSYLRCSM